MVDRVYEGFLRRQLDEARELMDSSDRVHLEPLGSPWPDRYRVRFTCRGLVRAPDGAMRETERFEVGIRFPADYLRRADPVQVLTWLGPMNVYHPNISDIAPVICIGPIKAGTPLVTLVERCYQVITYQKVTTALWNTLNPRAAVWAAAERDRFPVDPRPLRAESGR
ncbi:MAG: hypothetical protein ACRENB_05400 [Gemmatimonadales bacterium]